MARARLNTRGKNARRRAARAAREAASVETEQDQLKKLANLVRIDVKGHRWRVSYQPWGFEVRPTGLWGLLRHVVWECEGGFWTVSNIREQGPLLLIPKGTSLQRLGLVNEAMARVFALDMQQRAFITEMLLPDEYLKFLYQVIALKTAQTVDDFENGLLAKSRLGRWVTRR